MKCDLGKEKKGRRGRRWPWVWRGGQTWKRRKLEELLTTTHGEGRTEEGAGLSRAVPACWFEHQNKCRQHCQHSSSLELKIRFWEGVKGANWAKGQKSSTRDYKIDDNRSPFQEITEKAKHHSDWHQIHEAEDQAKEQGKMLKMKEHSWKELFQGWCICLGSPEEKNQQNVLFSTVYVRPWNKSANACNSKSRFVKFASVARIWTMS